MNMVRLLLLFMLPWCASQPIIQYNNQTKCPRKCLVKNIRNLGQITPGMMPNCTELLIVRLLYNMTTYTASGPIVTSLCPRKVRAREMAAMNKLKMLVLFGNCISNVETGTFMHLEELNTLWLSRNEVSHLFKGIFQGMTKLTTLWLSGNQISKIEVGSFSGLSSLQKLRMRINLLSRLKKTHSSDSETY